MIEDIQDLLEQYLKWLKDKTTLRQAPNDWIEITTPHLDRHNDYLQIYAKSHDGGYVLTDDGYTIDDLQRSGCNLGSPKRQNLLKMTLAGFGIQQKDNALEVFASRESFPLRKHNLLQAMLVINDMFFLAGPMVSSLFYEDVVEWLELNQIRYTPNVKFTGKSGFDHQYHFVIPKSQEQPERIVDAITRPSRHMAEQAAFKWIDTREVRSPESRAYAFLNDQEQHISPGIVDAFRSYDITPVLYSERTGVKQELVA